MNNFHLLAFQGSVAQNASLASIPLITDTVFSNVTGGYLPPTNFRAWMAYTQLDAGTIARLDTPNLRIPVYPYMSNLDLAADPPNLPPMNQWDDSGPTILQNDQFNMVVSRAGAGGSVSTGLVWLGQKTPSAVYGDVRTIRATSSITRVASQWVEGSLTLQDTLPNGRYQIVGLASFGTNLIATRFIFPDQSYRPGVIAQQAIGEYGWDKFRYGNSGVFGSFFSTALPTVQILGYGANTSQTHLIDIIKIG